MHQAGQSVGDVLPPLSPLTFLLGYNEVPCPILLRRSKAWLNVCLLLACRRTVPSLSARCVLERRTTPALGSLCRATSTTSSTGESWNSDTLILALLFAGAPLHDECCAGLS